MSDWRVLVTGARGFVGRHTLAPLASLGFEVHGLARHAQVVEGVVMHACDLSDAAATQCLLDEVRPSHVLHCAWFVEHGAFWTAPQNHDWVHYTTALALAAARSGVEHFVGVGTCAEYDWTGADAARPRREGDPLARATLYGECKRAAWEAVQAQPLRSAWARLFHLFGPGEAPARLVPSIVDALRAGHAARLGPGHYVRDFMAVQDAGLALATLVALELEGPVNVASGEALTVRAIAEALASELGRPDLLQFGTLPAREGDIPVMRADVARLREEAGFAPAAPLLQRLRQVAHLLAHPR